MPTVIPIESKILLDKKPTARPNIAKANKGTALKKKLFISNLKKFHSEERLVIQ